MIIIVLILAVALVMGVRSARNNTAFVPEFGAVGWVDGTRWSVVAPLARVEVRRLLLHPAFLAGAAITPFILLLATARDSSGDEWLQVSGGIALGLAPFGWFTIAAAQLLTTRPARTGADSLLASLPASQPTRTAALLATMAGTVVVAALFAAATIPFVATQGRALSGSPNLGEIGAGLLLAAGAVTVGVAVGRFLPHPMFAVGGAFAVIFLQTRFLDPTTWPWDREEASPIRFLGFLATPTSAPSPLEFRPAAWHLVYLVGLTAVMVVVALARNGVPRALAGALAVALAVTAVGGWFQTRQAPAGRVAEMVSFLEEPAAHQTCVERASGRYCTFDPQGKIAQWDARARDILALVPRTPGRLVVTERMPTVIGNSNCTPVPFTESLIPGVARAMDPQRVWRADGAIHPGTDYLPCSSTSVKGLFFAVQVGSWAVGLPSSPGAGDARCYADNQSRSALALWLGAAVTPGGEARLARLEKEESGDHFRFADWNDPPMFGVRFALDDARIAVAMLDRPANEVATTLAPHWARLTAPGTPTAELVSLLGLANTPAAPLPLTPACA